MKFFLLIWAGLWRKKGPTALNLLSIFAAFTLFGTLQGISTLLSSAGNTLKGNRLLVLNQESGMLPTAYRDQILLVPGVVSVDFRNNFNGIYQKPSQAVDGIVVDSKYFFQTSTEFHVTSKQIADLTALRRGILVDVGVMQKYNWKIGDQIMLKCVYDPTTGDGAGNWVFDIIGSYKSDGSVALEAFAIAILFALVIGLWPARRAMRIEIIDAINGH